MDEMKWYIVNTHSSCEAAAKASIEDRMKRMGLGDAIAEIVIPQADVVQLVKGKKQTRAKKFFPGYMFIKMKMNDKSWHLVTNSSKVSGFVSVAGKPAPITEEEVTRVTDQMATGTAAHKATVDFSLGEAVIVIDGPFNNFNGTVEEINQEKGKVKVLVSIFGRPTPVELDFVQVEKA